MKTIEARRFLVRGTVQGVGFRPFIAGLAEACHLSGWVLNAGHGVEIHIEGRGEAIEAFARALERQAPAAARIEAVDSLDAAPNGFDVFQIRKSEHLGSPTVRISPDLPQCGECLREMLDRNARRFGYPYINCSHCGPRFSIVRALPYDRERTTMAPWPLCSACEAEYQNGGDRRFHAEPVACPRCGPQYRLLTPEPDQGGDGPVIVRTACLLRQGALVAIKGVGGYHLSCDAANPIAVARLRERKYRKSRPFAVMAKDLATARTLVDLDEHAETLLTSSARPIVLAPARLTLPDVAPNHRELGVMLPYAPIHHLLFAAGAPDVLVMTSANRSSEPIAFEDADALNRLDGIAEAFLMGERPIARRVDDSVVRAEPGGPVILRRGRGYAPAIVARLPASRPILAVGADLKNTITLVIDGHALTSQHIGDLEHLSACEAFQATIQDLTAMYELNWDDVLVAHDQHPHYASTAHALGLPAAACYGVQHHRAHVASVAAERGALETVVLGVAFDGTGYGDDGTIWGGEFFIGSVSAGFSRVASLRPFALPGGDAAARHPVQAAAGLLSDVEGLPDLTEPPFCFPRRYRQACQLARNGLRTFVCTSAGRLFDGAAAILGFTHEIEYEGQAAEWLEQRAWLTPACDPLPFVLTELHADLRPALGEMIRRRNAGGGESVLARSFHETIAAIIAEMAQRLCDSHSVDTVVLSGGTFQNALLVDRVRARLAPALRLWTNAQVPPNDGGISLGQAALAAMHGTAQFYGTAQF
jgi:hydrogenase maturation protein HypF